jgi:hypothetical protein
MAERRLGSSHRDIVANFQYERGELEDLARKTYEKALRGSHCFAELPAGACFDFKLVGKLAL